MNKSFFILMLIMCGFSSLINAYEYIICDIYTATGNSDKYVYYYDNSGILKCRYENANGDITINTVSPNTFYATLGNIGYSRFYVSKEQFKDFYSNDLIFLNDLYLQQTNPFLNLLYSDFRFDQNNYIRYENYELLYNSEGLAVESIVNGVWAGLYNDNEKRRSGRLYSRTGELVYLNGVEVEHASLYDVINELLVVSVMEVFGIYSRAAVYAIYFLITMVFGGVILAVYLVTGSMDNTGSRGGARWVAAFTANGVRKSRWNRFDPDNYHYQTGHQNFSSYRDYQDYERGLSNGTRSPIRKRRIF